MPQRQSAEGGDYRQHRKREGSHAVGHEHYGPRRVPVDDGSAQQEQDATRDGLEEQHAGEGGDRPGGAQDRLGQRDLEDGISEYGDPLADDDGGEPPRLKTAIGWFTTHLPR